MVKLKAKPPKKTKKLTHTGANVVRTILKNLDAFQADLRSQETEGNRTTYIFDVFYQDTNGTFTIAKENGEIVIAVLNLSMSRIVSLVNDANIRKLAQYVLDNCL
ncbi:MAG: hypothetical protein HDR44_03065 [Allobaculum sp.]|nr:hypothetical protein [Allobaculum sp.]